MASATIINIDQAHIMELVGRFGRKCFYCRQTGAWSRGPDGQPWQKDHIIPRSKGGPDEASNLRLSCGICNWLKLDHDESLFQRFIQKFTVPPSIMLCAAQDDRRLQNRIRSDFRRELKTFLYGDPSLWKGPPSCITATHRRTQYCEKLAPIQINPDFRSILAGDLLAAAILTYLIKRTDEYLQGAIGRHDYDCGRSLIEVGLLEIWDAIGRWIPNDQLRKRIDDLSDDNGLLGVFGERLRDDGEDLLLQIEVYYEYINYKMWQAGAIGVQNEMGLFRREESGELKPVAINV
jgi:hypothetical protein